MEEIPEGTHIDYTYALTIEKWWLHLIATPLLKWYALRFWKRAIIDTLRDMLETSEDELLIQ